MLTESTKTALYQGAPFTKTIHGTRCLLIAVLETQRMRDLGEARAVIIVRWDGKSVASWSDIATWMGIDTVTDTLALKWLPIPTGIYGAIRDTGCIGTTATPPANILCTATGDYRLSYKIDGPLSLDTHGVIILGQTTETETYDYTEEL